MDGNCKEGNFLARSLVRVEYTVQSVTVKCRLIESQTHYGINLHFKLADLILLEAKPIIL
jgi:hypothetical protein